MGTVLDRVMGPTPHSGLGVGEPIELKILESQMAGFASSNSRIAAGPPAQQVRSGKF